MDTRDDALDLRLEAARGRVLVEESRESVVVLDDEGLVVATSARARQSLEGLEDGKPLPEGLLSGELALVVPYEVEGRRERLVYLSRPGDLAAYEELRAGFTASVSHELRTPLARLLVLLDSATLPSTDVGELIDQARAEVAQIRELIDDVLFLSELETGREVVALGSTTVLPVVREALDELADSADRAGIRLRAAGDTEAEIEVRPRLVRVVARNLAENAIRYAGIGATLAIRVARENGRVLLEASDDGQGVAEEDLSRLFERFYRADRARSSRGTGLGLAIVKHIVASAGGEVEASGAPGRGLTIRCSFPAKR